MGGKGICRGGKGVVIWEFGGGRIRGQDQDQPNVRWKAALDFRLARYVWVCSGRELSERPPRWPISAQDHRSRIPCPSIPSDPDHHNADFFDLHIPEAF